MSENPTPTGASTGASLQAMKLAQLQALASELGVSGTAKMRKSDLVAAIENGGVVPAKSEDGAPSGTDAAAPQTSHSSSPDSGATDSGDDRAARAKEAAAKTSGRNGPEDSGNERGGRRRRGRGE